MRDGEGEARSEDIRVHNGSGKAEGVGSRIHEAKF